MLQVSPTRSSRNNQIARGSGIHSWGRLTKKAPGILLGILPVLLLAGTLVAEAQVFGSGSGDGELVSIAEILAAPDVWQGKDVRVSGEIAGVCPKKGCWMELRDGDASLRIKVDDDVIVFPADSTGHKAVAQGRVEVREMTREAYQGWARHLAEEQGVPFDEASIGQAPYRLIQIRGIGAEIDG